MSNKTGARNADEAAVQKLEYKKADLLVQIRELQLDLQRANVDLYRLGVDEAVDIRPFLRR